jgi:4-diphosphocytidyl-2-C-methyl-D-erythritol kinase
VLVLRAPAKVNLTLEVLARRADGYHALRSVMVPIGLYDEIRLEPSAAPAFFASDAALGVDNSVSRALEAVEARPYRVTLEKRIPAGAGLGGGSSDAASVLAAASEGQLGGIPERDWLATARSLGSDVPFFLTGTAALVEGTGERVTALGALPPWWVVVVRPKVAIATAEAYRMLAERREREPIPSRNRAASVSLALLSALQRGAFTDVVALASNDFHEPTVERFPEIARAHGALASAGATRSLLSGSGSCLFALCCDELTARALAKRVDRAAVADVYVAPFVASERWR